MPSLQQAKRFYFITIFFFLCLCWCCHQQNDYVACAILKICRLVGDNTNKGVEYSFYNSLWPGDVESFGMLFLLKPEITFIRPVGNGTISY
jgi:hypothetical protein